MEAELSVDFGPVEEMTTVVRSIVAGLEKKSTLNMIASHIARTGRVRFGTEMDIAAKQAPMHYSHLYEARGVGQKTNRLFELRSTQATGGQVTLRSEFVESKKPVAERPLVGQTIPVRIKNEDGSWDVRRMEVWPNQKQHIFRDKATIMEHGLKVKVKTDTAKRLFWVDPKTKQGTMTKTANIDYSTSKHPTYNQFTESWKIFWESRVDELVIVPAVKRIEAEVQPVIDSVLNKSAAASQSQQMVTGAGGRLAGGIKVLKNGVPFTRVKAKINKSIEGKVVAAVSRALKTEGEL